jgi:hypothetical protein
MRSIWFIFEFHRRKIGDWKRYRAAFEIFQCPWLPEGLREAYPAQYFLDVGVPTCNPER